MASVHGDRTSPQAIGEILAIDELHGERANVARLLDAEQLCDVRMIERGQRLGFTLEARETVRIGGEQLRQDLQRDVTAQPRVAGSIDFAHPAGADGAEDLIGAEPAAS